MTRLLACLIVALGALWSGGARAAEADLYCQTGTSSTGFPVFQPASAANPCPVTGGGGGGGGAVTIADGADVTQGAIADTSYTTGSGTVVSVLKGIFGKLNAALAVTQSGAWNITNVSGTVSLPTGAATAANQGTPYPPGAAPITASTTGTTAATTATLAADAAKFTYICGFSIRANATAAATGNSTVTGTVTATLNFTQWTAPLASGIGITEMIFSPCVRSSAINTGVAVISAAPGSGGVVSVSAWGFQL